MVVPSAEPRRTMQRPPKAQAHRPEQVEILCRARPVCIRTELRDGLRIHLRLGNEQEFPRALNPLRYSLQPEQHSINCEHPKQSPQPARQQWCAFDALSFIAL